MSMAFPSPSMRAAASDLTVSISPLGLVELADEEFEVHGPRLNRYASNLAWFLGHHWGYKREAGETQLTFNYAGAFSRFITNFSFSRGVHFASDKAYEHIVPALLKRVWETDNRKDVLLMQIGELGGVCGDVFIKVAYEPKWTDDSGLVHPGRVRLLAINPTFAFPEYHPHDPERIIRFKLKYRFWGTSTEGTRQVYTYTEIITDQFVEEYINDELIDSHENGLGVIPIVHIANIEVPGSPWGLSDIADIISINREYNEQATNISEIIDYHSAPVTVIIGAKASNLEKGPRKVWGGLPKDARVENLENNVDLEWAIAYLDTLKTAMHEMTGVPVSALGQSQPVSNTSGVALAIQYQPMMLRYHRKLIQYSAGLAKVNEFALRTLFIFEPETLVYDPDTEGLKTEDDDLQADVLDPADFMIYRTVCDFPPPLPVDVLIKLNEIQVKLALGLISKRGSLRELGEEFPADTLAGIYDEQMDEAKRQGALDLLKAQISSVIISMTGLPPEGVEVPPPGPTDDASGGAAVPQVLPGLPGLGGPNSDMQQIQTELVALAAGTRLAQRRNPDTNNAQET
jgi:hypothetical protein